MFSKIPFYLLIICASSCSCLLWHLLKSTVLCIACALLKCAVHSTLQGFFFFSPLLRTEVKTPVDLSIHLIGSVSLNQPVMELMAVCHPWRYKFPGGVSCRQCMKYALCASKDWQSAEGQGASLARRRAGLPGCQATELASPLLRHGQCR